MEKLEGKSANIEEKNIEKLKELFPNVVTEGKIDFDMLRNILGDEVNDSREKYQFTWNGKLKSIKISQIPSAGTLRPVKEKSVDWDTTDNIYIEGDNLEVLKLLQKTYNQKIDVIYIDPPYNTGSDFIYNDDFKSSIQDYKNISNQNYSSNPSTSGRFHTDWLNMMYPRIILGRNLLTNYGVMFISIDDNEVVNARKILDEIFGENNCIGLFIQNKQNSQNDAKNVQKNHEYILCYARNRKFIDSKEENILSISKTEKQYLEKNDNGYFYIGREIHKTGANSLLINRPNLGYTIYYNEKTKDIIAQMNYNPEQVKANSTESIYTFDDKLIKAGYIPVIPPKQGNKLGRWTWMCDKVNNEKDSLIYYKGSSIVTFKKVNYIEEKDIKKDSKGYYCEIIKNENCRSIIDYSTSLGTEDIKKLFNIKIFDNPKSVDLMKFLLSTCQSKDITVLDFFSGSATTAHAVMELNAEDNGHRKFILVQIPEKVDEESDAFENGFTNICDIGEERIRRSSKTIKENNNNNGLFQGSLDKDDLDLGFKVFSLDSTNIYAWDNSNIMSEEQLQLLNDVFKKERSNEDVLYEIMLKHGIFDQKASIEKINKKEMYKVGERFMIVCLEDEVTDEDIKKIGEIKPKIVVFKENGFANDNDKINATHNLEKAGVNEIKCI